VQGTSLGVRLTSLGGAINKFSPSTNNFEGAINKFGGENNKSFSVTSLRGCQHLRFAVRGLLLPGNMLRDKIPQKPEDFDNGSDKDSDKESNKESDIEGSDNKSEGKLKRKKKGRPQTVAGEAINEPGEKIIKIKELTLPRIFGPGGGSQLILV
jgi:hypothetical protein